MDELTNRVVALEDVFGPTLLAEELHEAPDWPRRFALLDAALLRRAAIGPAPAPEVAWTLPPPRGRRRPPADRCASLPRWAGAGGTSPPAGGATSA